jgi:hypothetical protein
VGDRSHIVINIHQQNEFQLLEASSSVREDVESILRCVNFRRVSHPRKAFLTAIRVTGSESDKPGCTDDKPGCT